MEATGGLVITAFLLYFLLIALCLALIIIALFIASTLYALVKPWASKLLDRWNRWYQRRVYDDDR